MANPKHWKTGKGRRYWQIQNTGKQELENKNGGGKNRHWKTASRPDEVSDKIAESHRPN